MHHPTRRFRSRHGTRLALLVGVCLALTAGPLVAQEGKVEIVVHSTPPAPNTSPTPVTKVALRPIAAETAQAYLSLKNDTPDEQDLTVTVQAGKDGPVIAGPLQIKVPPRSYKPVSFQQPEAPKPAPPGASPAPPKLVPLQGPDASFHVVVKNDDKVVDEKTIAVGVLLPDQYLDSAAVSASVEGGKKLVVKVKPRGDFVGPPCRLRLVMDPARSAGVRQTSVNSLLQASVSPSNQVGTMFMDNLQAPPGSDGKAYATITADDYPRAFVVEIPVSNGVLQATPSVLPSNVPFVNVVAARYTKPAEFYPVNLEIDNAAAVREIVLGIDYDENMNISENESIVLRGGREQKVSMRAGENGQLLFQVTTNDWTAKLPQNGIGGTREFQLKLRGAGANVLNFQTPTQADLSELIRPLTVDSTKPQDVKLVDLPETIENDGKPLPVKATGKDPESGITEVKFFWGKPVEGKEGQMTAPPDVASAKGKYDTGTGQASASLPVPEGRTGAMPVTVQFVNGLGESTFSTETVKLVEPPKPMAGGGGGKPKESTGTIKGKVLEFERAQPSLDVNLVDAKGAVVKKVKTGRDGTFAFEKIEPGEYTLVSVKTASGRAGTAKVKVEAGKTAESTINLKMP